AFGPVERDKAALQGEARRAKCGGPAVEDAAALGVAAVAAQAAGAAGGRVQDERRVEDGPERRHPIREAAPLARPALAVPEAAGAPWATTAITARPARPARPARAAEGSVSEERAVCHGHGRGGGRPN